MDGTLQKPRNVALIVRIVFDVVMTVVFFAALYVALGWPVRGAVLPLTAGGIGLVLSVLNLYRDVKGIKAGGAVYLEKECGTSEPLLEQVEEDSAAAKENAEFRDGIRYLALLGVFLVAMYATGVRVAAALFVGYFLWREARASRLTIVLGIVGIIAFLTLVETVLGLRMPRNLLGL